MRDQGRLCNWDDNKGFGFVTPDKGGLRAFVHIRAFSYRHRRPRNGDVITYQLAWDPKGRPRAENVLFRETTARSSTPQESPTPYASYIFCTLFFLGIVMLAAVGRLSWWLPLPYIVMSLFTFCLYAFDKSAAMNRRRRTPENTLQGLALLGGWPGALVAQRMFHHKSKKASFQALFWFIVVIHLLGLAMIASNSPMARVLMSIHDIFAP
jgi:uncharacterized membrane protein YsdA (DUF1294 family)/cold shock CspA family protein